MSATTTDGPPASEKGNPASGETHGVDEQNTIIETTTNQDSTTNQDPQLCADGLPPIISAEEFLAMDLEPPTGALFPCDECQGELAEPWEVENVRAKHPDWQPSPVCRCYDDEPDEPSDWPHLLMQRVRGEWDKDFVEKVIEVAGRVQPHERERFELRWISRDPELEDLEDFPSIVPLDEFMEEDIPERKVLIEGILKKESKLVLSGQSKLGKTFVMMSLAMAIVNGGEWLGFKCNKGTVLYVNLELHKDSTQQRFNMLKAQFGGFKGIDLLPLRGYAAPMDKIAARIKQRIKESGKDFDLIIIDPIYKTYGDTDENSAGDITKLMNQLDGVGLDTQTSIAFVHHDTKTGTRLSGSGVFARDPDAIISLQAVNQEEPSSDITVKMELRDFAPVESFTVSRDGFVFSRTPTQPKVRPAVEHAIKIVKILEGSEDGSMRRVDIMRALDGVLSQKKFNVGFKLCTDREWIGKDSKSEEYSIAPKGNEMLYDLNKGTEIDDTEGARIVGNLNGKCQRVYED